MTVEPTAGSEPVPHLIERRSTEYGGRGYFSCAAVPKNTTLLTVPTPFTSVVFRPFKKEVCAGCFSYENGKSRKVKLESNKLACASTKKKASSQGTRAYAGLYFCTEQCRDFWTALEDYDGVLSSTLDLIEQKVKIKNDIEDQDFASSGGWSSVIDKPKYSRHEAELAACLESEDYDTARFIATVVVKISRNEDHDFALLQSNEKQQLEKYPLLVNSHIRVYKFLKAVLPEDLNLLVTEKLIRDTVGREAGNAFGIWQLPLTMESECLGSALYCEASFFNHSCDPNVKKERIGREMVFTTTRDVLPGEQLCISYGMIQHLPVKERVGQLSGEWFFDCRCSRCSVELEQLAQQTEPKL